MENNLNENLYQELILLQFVKNICTFNDPDFGGSPPSEKKLSCKAKAPKKILTRF